MMGDGTLPAMAILACGALGLVVWQVVWPRSSGGLAPHLAIAALALSFLAASREASAASFFGSSPLWKDALGHFMRVGFLGMMSFSLCVDGAGWEACQGTRERHALVLLAACGGILAISATDFGMLWVGLELYTLSAIFSRRRARTSESTATARALGSGCLLFGCALLYASTGTLDVAILDRFLWEHGGPQPAMLYSGLGLVIGGIALSTGLLPPYAQPCLGDDVSSAVLGAALLLRLYLFGVGALAWECFWITVLLSLAALAWGCVRSLWTTDDGERVWALGISQRGFLLMALALMLRQAGLNGFLTALLGYGLAQAVAGASLHWARLGGGDERGRLLGGLARHTPRLGVPLVVGLLSLSGAPFTLGFAGRADNLWTAQELGHPWLAVVGLLVSVFCAWFYLSLAVSLVQGRTTVEGRIRVPTRVTVSLALAACALILLGVSPLPLESLASWVAGR